MDRDEDVRGPRGEHREARTAAGVTLATESFGVPGDPALLLIGGATWSMDWWVPDLCRALADRGLRVIRYDQRDTGASSTDPPGEPGYGPLDLAGDVVAVLDAHDVAAGSLLGLSMGGGLAQLVAATRPERVASLVLVATSPAADVGRELPPPTRAVLETFVEPTWPDWADRDAVVSFMVEAERPYAGPGAFAEAEVREIAATVLGRSRDVAAALRNPGIVAGRDAGAVDLGAITAPTLVVHGSADPLFPPEHAEALREALPATGPVLLLPGMGHQIPPRDTWPVLVPAVAAHVRDAAGPHPRSGGTGR